MDPDSFIPPDGWQWGILRDLCERVSVGYVSSTRAFFCNPGEGVRLIRSQNIRPGRLILEDTAWVTHEFHEANPKSQLKPGDILITRVGANAGDVCIVPEGAGDLHCSSAVYARPLPQHAKYLELFCRSAIGQYLLRTRIVGSVSERINTRDAEVLPVLVPPLPEQKRIAHILGTLDDKIELNRRMNATLEAMSRAIFKSWFVDFDPVRQKAAGKQPVGMDSQTAALFPDSLQESLHGPIPDGWVVDSIKNRASNIQYGFTQSATSEPVGPHFLRITDISGGQIDWTSVPFCQATVAEQEKYRIVDGDIVIARTGASTGDNTYIVEPPLAVFASYLVRIQFSSRGVGRLVGEFARTSDYASYVTGMIGGSAQPNASAQTLAAAPMVFPTEEVANAFYVFVRPLDISRAANDRESRTLAALRDTLLPKLLSGELRVPEAEGMVEEAVG